MAALESTVIDGNLSICTDTILYSPIIVMGNINGFTISNNTLTSSATNIPTSKAVADYIASTISSILTIS